MINIMKTVAKILLKRKSFLITTFILPIILIFVFAGLNSGHSTINVAVINKDSGELGEELEEKISNLQGVDKVEINNENYMQDLIYHQFEMVITIDKDFTDSLIKGDKAQVTYETISKNDSEVFIKSVLNSEVSAMAKLCNNIDVKSEGIDKIIKTFRASQPQYEVLNKKNIKPSITSSLGMIFYLLFITAAGSCSFLLEDEKEGTKDRILMGNISERQYYVAECAIFFIFTAVPSIEYYAICKMYDYEFGFDNTVLLLMIVLLMSLLAVTFSIMIASIIKSKSVFNLISSALTVPVFMLSGAFWDFEMMNSGLQRIGNTLPPRWIFMAVRSLQAGNGIEAILPMVIGIVTLSIFFLLLGVFFTRNKIVMIKQNG